MLKLEEQALLESLAYQSWLERGQPIGSPEVDWERAKQRLQAHYAAGIEVLNAALEEKAVDEAPSVVKVKLDKKSVGKPRRSNS
jgi:hypothetical protein